MKHFRFRLPSFLSSDTPSRAALPPPPPLRPPFRPAGVAPLPPKAPSPPKASTGTEPKASPLEKSKSSRKGAAEASSSASPSPSSGASTSSQQVKQTRKSKQHVSLSGRSEPVLQETTSAVVDSLTKNQHGGANVKGSYDAINEVEPRRESAKEARELQKKKEEERLVTQDTKKAVHEGREDATQNRIVRPVATAMKHVRMARDQLDTKMQNEEKKSERFEDRGNGDDAKKLTTTANDPKTRSVSTDSHVNTSGEGSLMSKRVKEDIKDGISKLTMGKSDSNSDEKHVSVVTLSGENRGATMQIASDKAKSDSAVHIHRGYRSNPDESPFSTSSDNEERRGFKARKHPKEEEEESQVKTYVNCNAQSINNSIVFDSSVAEHNPGAHVNVSVEEAKKASGSPEKKKTVAPPPPLPPPEKKPAKEPRVRRRCLRGLMAEPSESETENPLKPRRHGCRFSCKGKDNGDGIF